MAYRYIIYGEMTEWLKVAVLKTAVPETVPWVRIPLSPPDVTFFLFVH
jgi:hypothetical protein